MASITRVSFYSRLPSVVSSKSSRSTSAASFSTSLIYVTNAITRSLTRCCSTAHSASLANFQRRCFFSSSISQLQRPQHTLPTVSPSSSFSTGIFHDDNLDDPKEPNTPLCSHLSIQRKMSRSNIMPPFDELGFGNYYSDHMIEIDWTEENGWSNPMIKPLQNLSLHPGISSLHYGISVFEGLKAFKNYQKVNEATAKTDAYLFRPIDHIKRFNRSLKRMAMPTVNTSEFLKIIENLIQIDHKFIPIKRGFSMYLRPVAFSTFPTLGVNAAKEAKLVVVACPSGAYFGEKIKGTNIYVETEYNRSFPGHVGDYKASCNYAPTIYPCLRRMKEGYNQILWTFRDVVENDYKWCEGGAMSLFLHWKNEKGQEELLTPPLENNLILPGVIRNSILKITKDKFPQITPIERDIFMEKHFIKAFEENRILNVLLTGTGAVVCPVWKLTYKNTTYDIERKWEGSFGELLYNELVNIQHGIEEHPYAHKIEV